MSSHSLSAPQISDGAPYGIVGDGQAARHLGAYFRLLNISYSRWSRRLEAEGRCASASVALAGSPVILVALADSAIDPWIENYLRANAGNAPVFIHLSGALQSARAHAWHPLTSFANPQTHSREHYEQIPFIGSLEDTLQFEQLFPRLPNPHFRIPAADRALYHSLCVMAGNMSVLLWQKMLHEFRERWGMPFSALRPYMKTVSANLLRAPEQALSGPLARGDRATLAQNMSALKGDPYAGVYRAFVEAYDQSDLHIKMRGNPQSMHTPSGELRK